MKGIFLKESIKLFGFVEGTKFYFKWCFSDPVKIFWWKYIVGKPLCTEHGYFLCKPDCNAEKIYGRRNIIKYEKERHKRIDIEMNEVEMGKDGLCVYCGEENATCEIDNPNMDKINKWAVCVTCKKIIEQQQKLSFGSFIADKPYGKELGEKMIKESNNEIKKLSYESGKETYSTIIDLRPKENKKGG